ncbi:DNA polymerase zeta processivity subunit [Monosporozyma servazzii]
MTRHPGLEKYIEDWIQDILTKLTHIYKVSILILDQTYDIVLERYILDFSEFKHLEDMNLNETEVFDEFRSSLNSLINKVSTLSPIKDNTVTFNFMINSVYMELGHGKDVGWNLSNQEQLQKFENDTNWTRVHDEDKQNFINVKEKPVIKMVSLIGCDIGSLIIHNYMELLQLNKIEQIPLKINDIYDVPSTSLNSTPF